MQKGQVVGPLGSPEIEALGLAADTLYWSRGQAEWIAVDRWRELVAEEKTEAKEPETQRLWRIKIKDKEWAAMPHAEMIKSLKSVKDLSEVLVWTEGYQSWREIFQIHKIMDELGVSRRQHPRVPIVGQFSYEIDKKPMTAPLCTISEGGCGVNNSQGLTIGTKLKASLQSPHLAQNMIVSCEVVFSGEDGYAGIRFLGLNSEFKGLIIEYVKKFSERTHPR